MLAEVFNFGLTNDLRYQKLDVFGIYKENFIVLQLESYALCSLIIVYSKRGKIYELEESIPVKGDFTKNLDKIIQKYDQDNKEIVEGYLAGNLIKLKDGRKFCINNNKITLNILEDIRTTTKFQKINLILTLLFSFVFISITIFTKYNNSKINSYYLLSNNFDFVLILPIVPILFIYKRARYIYDFLSQKYILSILSLYFQFMIILILMLANIDLLMKVF